MSEQLRIILIIIVSVSIFGIIVFVMVKNYIRNKIQYYLEEKNKYLAVAETNILESKFQVLTGSLNLPPDADPSLLTIAYDEITRGTFGGNQELVKLYNSLSLTEQRKFKEYSNKKARSLRSDMQFQMLSNWINRSVKSDVDLSVLMLRMLAKFLSSTSAAKALEGFLGAPILPLTCLSIQEETWSSEPQKGPAEEAGIAGGTPALRYGGISWGLREQNPLLLRLPLMIGHLHKWWSEEQH